MTKPLISVKDLTLRFQTDEGLVTAVNNVSFDIAPGEVLGLVGESGSGKSVTAKSLMMLNAENAVYDEGSQIMLHVDGEDYDVLNLRGARDQLIIRGGAISMIFQEPMASFAPAITIGEQMVEQLLIHSDMTRTQAKEISIEMLTRVGIPEPAERFGQYAFEFSGGMRQRAMIAMALSTKPRLLIADEPTTALDVTIQAQIIAIVKDLRERLGTAVVWITHDLGVIAGLADRVIVMYGGRVVEEALVRDLYATPAHPYTVGLLASLPRLDQKGQELVSIPGQPPSLYEEPTKCSFAPRCAHAFDRCLQEVPELIEVRPGHHTACFWDIENERPRA